MDCFEPDEFRLLAEYLRTEDFFFEGGWDSIISRAGETGRSSIPERVGERGRAGRLEQAPDIGVAEQGGAFGRSAVVVGAF